MAHEISPLTETECARYGWQMSVAGMGEAGQQRLKHASVLVSRAGGLGGLAAYELAAAGVGRIVIAHGGMVRPGDLNRQLLITDDWLGKPRIECITRRLLELNPHIEIIGVPENITPENAGRLVGMVDMVVDAAPLFTERFALNDAIVRQGKPMVEAAMFGLEARLLTIKSGQTPCLRCVYPEAPPDWRRQFPVFGAVSGSVGCMAAMEVIKLITGIGQPLLGRMLAYDLRDMSFRTYKVQRDPRCPVCSTHPSAPSA
ncbi:MAG: HesA/MoeB/ThiF family protein [Phycisphaerae bacterium]